MSEADLIQRARSIVASTFIDMALEVPDSEVSKSGGYTLVSGPPGLSICNFAIQFNLGGDAREVVAQMEGRSRSRPTFNVFSVTGDSPPDLENRWIERGFQVKQNLTTLMADRVLDGEVGELIVAGSQEQRLRIGEFMVSQFFLRTSEPQRQTIALALAASKHSLLFAEDQYGLLCAAMMVNEEPGIALYNLCVREDRRSDGIGAGIVRLFSQEALSAGKPLFLQAGAPLETWYLSLGMSAIGTVRAYST